MSLWRRLCQRHPSDDDVDRELHAHLDLEAEERQADGLSPRQARDAALRAFGNPALVREDVRAQWRHTGLEQLVQDARYALRGLRRNPAFAATAILSLALGIGATTAVVSVLNAVALQPLAVAEPLRLGRILVAAQFALPLLLVTSAGLLLRTMLHVLSVDPGFNPSHAVLLDVRDNEPAARYGEADTPGQKARRAARYHDLDQRLNALPGVDSSALSWLGLFSRNYVGLNTYDVQQPGDSRFTLVDYISPLYFDTVGMRLLRGFLYGVTPADPLTPSRPPLRSWPL